MTGPGIVPPGSGKSAEPRRRILFLIGQLGHGGSEKQMALTALGLRGRFEVEVLCASKSPDPYGNLLRREGVQVHWPPAGGRAGRFLWIAKTLKKLRYDILFAFSINNALALLVHLLGGGKLVYTERSLGVWKSRSYILVDGLLYRRATLILSNSEATRQFILRRYPWADAKLRVIYNGIDAVRPDSRPASQRPHATFCLVAGFRPWKGHRGLVEAAAILAKERRDFRVVLVGDGPERAAVEALVTAEGLSDLIEFVGWQEDPVPFLAGADVNLNVSSHESLSNAVMEGMLLGKPSIVTRVGGNPELVTDGVHGRVVSYGDPAALAAAMRACMEDRETASLWGARARAKMEQEFSKEAMVRKTGDLLEQL